MKKLITALLFASLTLAVRLHAEDKNGYRVVVQKTTLNRDDVRGPGYFDDTIDRTLALKVAIKNISLKEKAEASVTYTIIVSRWGTTPPTYEKYSGTEKLAALKQQDEKELTLGKARIAGLANYANKRYQDKIEAWQIVIQESGGEATAIQSNANFTRLAEKARKPATD